MTYISDEARENREHVRRLLKEKQPDLAAALESVEREFSFPICHGWSGFPAIACPDGRPAVPGTVSITNDQRAWGDSPAY